MATVKESKMPKKPWTPLQIAQATEPSDALIREWMKHFPEKTRAEVLAIRKEQEAGCVYWVNEVYQVEVRPMGDNYVNLNIRRLDGDTIFRDWRVFQRIKDEIVGPECEAVELYPAESRLVDASNKYHLYACTVPGWRFPLGFEVRDVSGETGATPGTRQRPFRGEVVTP